MAINRRVCDSSTTLILLQMRRSFSNSESTPLCFLRENHLRHHQPTFGASPNQTNQLTVSSHFPQPLVVVVSSTPPWSCTVHPYSTQITGTTFASPHATYVDPGLVTNRHFSRRLKCRVIFILVSLTHFICALPPSHVVWCRLAQRHRSRVIFIPIHLAPLPHFTQI